MAELFQPYLQRDERQRDGRGIAERMDGDRRIRTETFVEDQPDIARRHIGDRQRRDRTRRHLQQALHILGTAADDFVGPPAGGGQVAAAAADSAVKFGLHENAPPTELIAAAAAEEDARQSDRRAVALAAAKPLSHK